MATLVETLSGVSAMLTPCSISSSPLDYVPFEHVADDDVLLTEDDSLSLAFFLFHLLVVVMAFVAALLSVAVVWVLWEEEEWDVEEQNNFPRRS